MKTQFHIKGSTSAEDRMLVVEVLISAAELFGMLDTTVTSRVPDTIRCYSETARDSFATGARVVDDIIIVDLFDGRTPSLRYPEIEAHFAAKLQRIFGDRVSKIDEAKHIPPHNNLPFSDAARDFLHRRLKRNEPAA